MPWQQDAADVALEYDPVTGDLRFSEVDITVPRQSGKTALTLAKKVHRLTVAARRLGPQRSTYTAQTRLKARQKLEKDFAEALRRSRSFREVPHARARPTKATEWRLSLNNGSESIQFGSGSYLQIDAPSRTGGHGDTLDDGTIDEAFAQEDDTVEAAMMPSMATRRNAQLWVISTAGDIRSVYLWRKVLAGRAASASGQHGRVCYIEFSAPDDADPGDPQTWSSCMPALGHTIREDFIRSEWERAQRKGTEGINTFRRAYLNQWPEIPVLPGDDAPVTPFARAWAPLCKPDMAKIASPTFGLAVSTDRSWSSLVAAGSASVEVARNDPGTGWVVAECVRLGAVVALNPGSPAGALLKPLKDAGVNVRELKGGEWAQACGQYHDAVMDGRIAHRGDPELDLSVRKAITRPSGEAWVFSQRLSPVDISPLCAAVAATYASQRPEPSIRNLG